MSANGQKFSRAVRGWSRWTERGSVSYPIVQAAKGTRKGRVSDHEHNRQNEPQNPCDHHHSAGDVAARFRKERSAPDQSQRKGEESEAEQRGGGSPIGTPDHF